MENLSDALVKILVDKGLLALILAGATAFLARSLERLKASLAWGTEVLKQRMAAAKLLLTDLKRLQHEHVNAVMVCAYTRGISNSQSFFGARDEYLSHLQEAKLLFSDSIVKAFDEVDRLYSHWMSSEDKPPIEEAELHKRHERHSIDLGALSVEEVSWSSREREAFKIAVNNAIEELQKAFPRDASLVDGVV